MKFESGSFVLPSKSSKSRVSSKKYIALASQASGSTKQSFSEEESIKSTEEIFSKNYKVTEVVDVPESKEEVLYGLSGFGERIYQKGIKIAPAEQRLGSAPPDRIYYVVTAYLDDTSPEGS